MRAPIPSSVSSGGESTEEIVGEGDPQRFSAHFGDSAHAKLPQAELGFEFYEAVRALGKVETELVIYPDQPHGVRDPRLLRDLMMRNVEWFTRLIPVAGAGATSEQRFVVRQVASEFLTNPFPNVETV